MASQTACVQSVPERTQDRLGKPGGLAGMKGFEPSVSALTGQRVRPLHHTPERREVYHSRRDTVKAAHGSGHVRRAEDSHGPGQDNEFLTLTPGGPPACRPSLGTLFLFSLL